jgi:hypothetical protein
LDEKPFRNSGDSASLPLAFELVSDFQVLMNRLLVIAGCALLGFAVSAANAKNTRALPAGIWGGEHILFQVSVKGAEIEFDCARGQIAQPLRPDAHGNFVVSGTFTPEHGGPVRGDEEVSATQATYSGHVVGDAMRLTVTRKGEKVGSFSLTRGRQPNLRKCR